MLPKLREAPKPKNVKNICWNQEFLAVSQKRMPRNNSH